MISRWLKHFQAALDAEVDQCITTLTMGSPADYAAYCKEVGKIEAYRRMLEIATEIDEKIVKGD